jgi:hypothetical protein
MGLDPDRIRINNSLDPDPDAANPDPKHLRGHLESSEYRTLETDVNYDVKKILCKQKSIILGALAKFII